MEKQNKQPIKFYKKTDQWGVFSNFYPSPIIQNGITYPTNQHYFQSKKFQGKQWAIQIANAKTPAEAFKMGQSRQLPIRQNWNQIKDQVMLNGLRLKYTQNQDLKAKLLSTGDRKLIQHTNKDSYWGDGHGKGQNKLGLLLMKLRDQLKQK